MLRQAIIAGIAPERKRTFGKKRLLFELVRSEKRDKIMGRSDVTFTNSTGTKIYVAYMRFDYNCPE
jgi:hypothetical protein